MRQTTVAARNLAFVTGFGWWMEGEILSSVLLTPSAKVQAVLQRKRQRERPPLSSSLFSVLLLLPDVFTLSSPLRRTLPFSFSPSPSRARANED